MPYYKCDVRKEEFITTIMYAENEADARAQVNERIRQSVLLHGGTVTCACTGVTRRDGTEAPPSHDEEFVDTLACRTCGRMPSARMTGEESWTVECKVCTEGPAGIAPGEGQAMDGWNEAVRMTCYPRVGRTRDEAQVMPDSLPCPTCSNAASYWRNEKVWTVGCGFCLGPSAPTGVSEDRDTAISKWNEAVQSEIVQDALPCPACGGAASCWRNTVDPDRPWMVGCSSTECEQLLSGASDDSKVEAIKEWNKAAIQAKAVSELLKCPTCHNLPSCGRDDDTSPWTVECMVCRSGEHLGVPSDDKAEAINSWNDAARPVLEPALPNTLPCPVCFNEPSCEKDEDELWTVKCMICRSGDHVGVSPDDEAGAIDSWNDAVRPAPETQTEEGVGGLTITSEALPCPTCSNLPSCGRKEDGAGPWRVGCMTCPSVLGRVGISDERIVAIDAWNDAVRSVDASDETCPVCDKEGSQ